MMSVYVNSAEVISAQRYVEFQGDRIIMLTNKKLSFEELNKGKLVATLPFRARLLNQLRSARKADMMKRIGLAKAIELLRDELAEAQDAGQGHQFKFEISEVEVELLVELQSEGGAGVEAGFGVVSAGIDGKVSRGDTHRLLLKLKVKDAATGGRNLEVGRDEARDWPAQ